VWTTVIPRCLSPAALGWATSGCSFGRVLRSSRDPKRQQVACREHQRGVWLVIGVGSTGRRQQVEHQRGVWLVIGFRLGRGNRQRVASGDEAVDLVEPADRPSIVKYSSAGRGLPLRSGAELVVSEQGETGLRHERAFPGGTTGRCRRQPR